MPPLVIRESRPSDLPAIEALYPNAFPDEDLLPLVRDLLAEPSGVLSLVALEDDAVRAHIAFTRCAVDAAAADADADTDTDTDTEAVDLLGPLAVTPEAQRRGFGGALIEAGLKRLRADRVAKVLVLGDPAYYRRFGFETETDIKAPYPLPAEWAEAWRSLTLRDDAPRPTGPLRPPPIWVKRAYWAP